MRQKQGATCVWNYACRHLAGSLQNIEARPTGILVSEEARAWHAALSTWRWLLRITRDVRPWMDSFLRFMDLAQENPHHGHITGGLQRPRLGAHVAGRLRVALLDSGRWTVDRHSRIPHAEDDWLWGGKTDDCEGWVSAAALDFHARGHCAEGRQLAHTPAPAGSASEGLGDDPWWSSGRDLWTSRSDLSSGADVAASGDLVPGTKVMARYRSSRGRLSREWYPGSVLATSGWHLRHSLR